MNDKGEGAILIIVIIVLLFGAGTWYMSNRQRNIKNCALRAQDAYLEYHYGSDRYKLPLSELTKTYQDAKAQCRG